MNKNKLISVMVKYGDTQRVLAEALGITRVTLCSKINEKHGAVFTQPEMRIIKTRYSLTDKEVAEIFFDDVVS